MVFPARAALTGAMTNTSPPPAAQPAADNSPQDGPRPERSEVLDFGRLRRSLDERRLAGVAGGLARHLDIDPIIVRVTLVVLVFFGGAGLVLYGAAWLLVPEEGSPAQPLGLDDRNRGIALVAAGILAALAVLGDSAGAFWFPWPVVIIGLAVAWFLHRKNAPAQLYYPPAPGQPAAAQPVGGTVQSPTQQPYLPYDHTVYVKPRKPRKRGPILFWFTLALIATGIGTLGVIDIAGTEVPAAAYPALGLALTGAMLLVGAFWGRAGGLIFIGLVLSAATLAVTAGENYDDKTSTYRPTSATEVRDSYDIDGGEVNIDLSAVRDVEELDGRDIAISAGAGEVEVTVPDGMDVSVVATAGVGEVRLFGDLKEGFDINHEASIDGGDDVPAMRIVIDLGVGQVIVTEQAGSAE